MRLLSARALDLNGVLILAKINENYQNVKDSYLFSDIAKRVANYSQENPGRQIIKLGIGDVTLPLMPAAIAGLHDAVDEMSRAETFHGYGPEQGYDFLRSAIHAIIRPSVWSWRRTKSLSATAPKAISAILPTCSRWTIPS
jgi:DNA-binding transcriptional MocR family regulator